MRESAQSSSPGLVQFGKYLLDEEIARGGMARVYLARLRGLGGFEKKLVVKQVLPELASDPRFVSMFVEEAKTLVQMSHPHIVPVYELGVVDGVYFLAMEHVEGGTLAEMLEDGPLSPALVAEMGVQVCDALQYAHERFELIHRDVTTRNVIVDALGHTRLLDFGIAAKAEGTGEGEVFGSHGYMSPEQARGEAVDPRSDLFSLGTVLWEALTGEPAFLRDDVELTRTALLHEDAPSFDRDDIPSGLAAVLKSTFEAAPEHRPESAAKLGKSLQRWLSNERPEGVADELGARADAVRKRRQRRPSQRPPGAGGRKDPSGIVRSIATSVTLQKLLEDSDANPSKPPIVEGIEGTVRIPGRRDSDADPAEVATAAISAATKERTSEPPAAGNRLWAIVAIIAIAVAGVLGAREWLGEEPVAATVPQDVPETEPDLLVVDPQVDEGTEPQVEDPPIDDPELIQQTADPPDPPDPVPPVESSASLVVSASSWAEVTLDGRSLGNTPVRGVSISSGAHTLVLENPAMGLSVTRRFNAPPGASVRAVADFETEPPSLALSVR